MPCRRPSRTSRRARGSSIRLVAPSAWSRTSPTRSTRASSRASASRLPRRHSLLVSMPVRCCADAAGFVQRRRRLVPAAGAGQPPVEEGAQPVLGRRKVRPFQLPPSQGRGHELIPCTHSGMTPHYSGTTLGARSPHVLLAQSDVLTRLLPQSQTPRSATPTVRSRFSTTGATASRKRRATSSSRMASTRPRHTGSASRPASRLCILGVGRI